MPPPSGGDDAGPAPNGRRGVGPDRPKIQPHHPAQRARLVPCGRPAQLGATHRIIHLPHQNPNIQKVTVAFAAPFLWSAHLDLDLTTSASRAGWALLNVPIRRRPGWRCGSQELVFAEPQCVKKPISRSYGAADLRAATLDT